MVPFEGSQCTESWVREDSCSKTLSISRINFCMIIVSLGHHLRLTLTVCPKMQAILIDSETKYLITYA